MPGCACGVGEAGLPDAAGAGLCPAGVHVGPEAVEAGTAHSLGVLGAELGVGKGVGVLVLGAGPLAAWAVEDVHVFRICQCASLCPVRPAGDHGHQPALGGFYGIEAGVEVEVLGRAGGSACAAAHCWAGGVESDDQVVVFAGFPVAIFRGFIGEDPHYD